MTEFVENKKISLPDICRYIIIGELITIFFSPAISNLLEIILFAFCLLSKKVRLAISNNKNQPLFLGSIAFIGVLIISSTWSVAPIKETLNSLWGWRKILLLPIALVLFQESVWKDKASKALIIFSILACAFSYIGFFINHQIHGWEAGVIIRNHATQGMIFSTVAFLIFIKLIDKIAALESYEIAFLIAFILALVANVAYITPGRSGYLVLIILTISSLISYVMNKRRIFIPIILALAIPFLLYTSPIAMKTINTGVNEIQKDDGTAKGSMGQRLKLWGNTIEMIKDKPLIGVGIGGFEMDYSERVKSAPKSQELIVHDPHNQFLKIVAEMGFVGFLAFIFMLFTSLIQQPVVKHYRLLGVGVLVAWCGTSMFSSHFSTFTEGRFIYLWLGIMLSQISVTSNENLLKFR